MKKTHQKLADFLSFIKSFFLVWLWQTVTFSLLLLCYILYNALSYIFTSRFFPKKAGSMATNILTKAYDRIVLFSTRQERTINRINLIDLAIKNMFFKKSRAMITVGGMAIGIGAIVFLVSLGFGLQEMVVSRVARLDELKQADVTAQTGSREVLTDKTIATISELNGVQQVLPLIAIVARVEYQNSVTDMAVYGVTTDFLSQSAIQPSSGKIFDSNELSAVAPAGKVAGVSKVAEAYSDGEYELDSDLELPIEFDIAPNKWVKIRSQPAKNGTLVGYTRRIAGNQQGLRVWGDVYPEASEMTLTQDSLVFGPWISASFPIWLQEECEVGSPGCVDGSYIEAKDASGSQAIVEGYTALTNVLLRTTLAPSDPVGQVLGITSDEESTLLAQAEIEETDEDSAATTLSESEAGWIEIASESAVVNTQEVTTVSLGSGAKRLAVANRAMLQLLGLTEEEAIGKTFRSTFVVVGDLLDKPGEKIESLPEEYTIVAVTPDDKTPLFYAPFVDLRLLGITQYSQLKIVVSEPAQLSQVRKQIESLGFGTRSVADTVQQIDKLFVTARVLLAILGFVALSIAALGMFNTLTVSLLERTREVGLMKAMGMRSNEVRELFLTESLVMGFFGGILGILFGVLAGELFGLLLSIFSLQKGAGYIDVAYLPPSFVIFVFLLSLFVGVFTGIYPARRATRISALDALRYE